MSQLKLVSSLNLALLAAFISLHVAYVDSFSPYLPDSEEAIPEEENYDFAKQPSYSSEDKLLHRLLTKVFLENFNRASRQRMLEAQFASAEDGLRTPSFPSTQGQSGYGLGDIVKRKVFWQPLGYLPAGKKPVFDSSSSGGSSRVNIIRYG